MGKSIIMKKLVAILMLGVFSSCLQKYIDEIPQEQKDEDFIIEVPTNFDWSSISGKGIEVTLTHGNKITYALDSTLLELYDADDDLLDALTIFDGMAEFNVRIPSSATTLKVKSVATNVAMEFNVENNQVKLDIPDLSVFSFARIDSDSDGLFDQFDSAPFNGAVSVSINSQIGGNGLKSAQAQTKSASSYAIFEDLWPSKGDYDFNDLVVKTTFSWERGKSNYVEEIEGICEVENIGAGISLGLGFELFEIKGTNLYYHNTIIQEFDGVEDDKSVTNGFIVFSKVQNIGISEVQFKIKLKDEALKDFLCVPYLFRTDNPGHQVRPFGAPPTEGQTMSLFRSANDVSPRSWSWTKGSKFKYPLPADEAFYRTMENHPWGIEFISKQKFKPSAEGKTITKSYPKFRTWAESGGNKERSWYEYPE